MSEIELPVVSGETKIRAAIDILRQNRRSGLVTPRDARLIVLTAADLARHLRKIKRAKPPRSDAPIFEVEPGQSTLFAPQLDQSLPAAPQPAAIETVKSLMKTMGIDYAIAPTLTATIRVVTAHEGLARILGQRVLFCKCPTCDEEWAPEELHDSNKCPNEGATVSCS